MEELELGSLASIRALAARRLDRPGALDILIDNAGLMACPQGQTEDGFELQLGTHHLGHFLLTNLLEPQARARSRASWCSAPRPTRHPR